MSTCYWKQAAGEEQTAGCAIEDGQPRAHSEDNVVDMAAWKAENLVELEKPEEQASGLGQYEGRELVRRPRRKHECARVRAELVATLTVAVLILALIIWVLMF